MKKITKHYLAIYIRVSDPKQVKKGISLDDQEKRGKKLAKELGWDYIVFKDGGLTGSLSYADRPALNDCVDKIILGEIQGFFSVEIDRLSRQFNDGGVLLSIFLEKKVRLYDYANEVQIQDENVLMLQQIKLAIAQREITALRKRVKRVLDTNIEDGAVAGGILKYGYKKGPNKKLVISEDTIEGTKYSEAEVIRMIFQMAYDNLSMYSIAKALNGLKVPTRRMIKNQKMVLHGKEYTEFTWRDNTIFGILKDSIYKGTRVYNKWKGKYIGTDENGSKKFNKLNEAPQVYEMPELQIIPPTLFEAVQGRLANKHKFAKTSDKKEYLLKGLIVCGVCGKKYYGYRSKTGYYTYICSSGQHSKRCGNRGYNIGDLEELVINEVLKLDDTIKLVFSDSQFNTRNSDIIRQTDLNKKRLLELDEQKQRWFAAYGSGKLKVEDIEKQITTIDAEAINIKHIQGSLEKEMSIIKEKNKLLEVVEKGVKHFKRLKKLEDRATFLRDTISTINLWWVSVEEIGDSLDVPHYNITISYKFEGLENYVISKLISVDRSSKKGAPVGKWFTKILNEKVTLTDLLLVNEGKNKEANLVEIQYDSTIEAKPKMKRMKK